MGSDDADENVITELKDLFSSSSLSQDRKRHEAKARTRGPPDKDNGFSFDDDLDLIPWEPFLSEYIFNYACGYRAAPQVHFR